MFASLVLILIHIKKKSCNSQRANQTHLKRPKLTPGWEEKARAVNLISLWLTSSYFLFTPLLRALFSQWTHIFLSSKCPHFKHNVYLSGTSFSHSHPSAIMFHETITEQNISLKSLQCPVFSFLGGLTIIWIWRTIWSACSAFLPFIPKQSLVPGSVTSSVRSEAARQLLSERRFVWDWPALRQPKSPYTGNNRFLQLQATYLFVIIIFILKIVNLI